MNLLQEQSGSTVTNLLTGLDVDEYFSRSDATIPAFFLTDTLGSTIALADNSGSTLTNYTYEPFGATNATGASTSNPYDFTGRENGLTGLKYYRARYYHPGFQRFLSEDPMEFDASAINLYVYVENNPLSYVDPLGLDKQSRDCARLPDYISVNINVAIPTRWTGKLVGWSGVVAIDRHGGLYWSPVGVTVGKSLTGVAGSLTASWLNQCAKPTPPQLENFLTSHGFNIGGGFIGGVGLAYTPGAGTATQLGLYSPQFGASYNYSWKWSTIPVGW